MKFSWGKTINMFDYNFDGTVLTVVKYHPHLFVDGNHKRGEYSTEVHYHVEEMHESFGNIYEALVAWITYKHLGQNQRALSSGIARALNITK